jgi:hypothetical protein
VILMGKLHLPIRNIESHLIFCSKSATHHENGE